MNIYKLQYTDKEEGYTDLLAKGTYEVIEGEQVYRNGTQAIVYIGQIVEIPATETTSAVYYSGVFFDLMTTEEIKFEINEVFPEDHKHSFLGYEKNKEETSLIED
tara:strand:- start:256 stop:570 length:315 start_codon:yes stop_codon:yes gene_type:complete